MKSQIYQLKTQEDELEQELMKHQAELERLGKDASSSGRAIEDQREKVSEFYDALENQRERREDREGDLKNVEEEIRVLTR